MDDLLFERLERMRARVEPATVLQDLYFLDRVVRPLAGPTDADYRVPFLVEGLEARGFFSDSDGRWEAVELYDDLCDLCDIHSYASLARVLSRFGLYHREKAFSAADRQ